MTRFCLNAGLAAALLLVASVLAAPPAEAQAQAPAQGQGQGRDAGTRIQGRPTAAPPVPAAPAPVATFRDLREEMRRFVQSISSFARRYKASFAVIARGGTQLLNKARDEDDRKLLPAQAYMRSIDGVMVDSVYYGVDEANLPRNGKISGEILLETELARRQGLKVLAVDYANDPELIDVAYERHEAKGYVPFVAESLRLNGVPEWPDRPFSERPNSILSLRDVHNFMLLRESRAFGSEAQFALTMHKNNYDMLIVDVFHGRKPLSKRGVETLKFKRTGGKRLVLARVNIGVAASYLYYWKSHWREGAPRFIGAPVAGEPDVYWAEFWQPEWQRIISGDTRSYIWGVIDQGFDGVLLDGIDSFRFFETGGEIEPGGR